jgi:hypothetical protein
LISDFRFDVSETREEVAAIQILKSRPKLADLEPILTFNVGAKLNPDRRQNHV